MAIQGTQVPMYTKNTLFLYFSDFSIIYLFIYFMKSKKKKKMNIDKQKHVKQSKA